MRRPAKFALIGAGNTILALVVFNVLAVWLGVPTLAANAIAWSAGIANSFVWNRKWTFADRHVRPVGPLLLRFVAANVVAIAVSSGVIIGARALAGLSRHDAARVNAVEVVAIVAAFIVNYMLSSRWAFRDISDMPRETGVGNGGYAGAGGDCSGVVERDHPDGDDGRTVERARLKVPTRPDDPDAASGVDADGQFGTDTDRRGGRWT
jgi:putative flippase GtrA